MEVMMVCNFNFRLHLGGETLERTEGKDRRIRENTSNSRHRDTTAKALKSRNLLVMCLGLIRSQLAGMGKRAKLGEGELVVRLEGRYV